MEPFQRRVITASLLSCVLFAVAGQGAAPVDDHSASINVEVDAVLDFIRNDAPLHKILDNLRVPMTIAEDGLHITNMNLSKIYNLFRSGDATLSVINGSLIVNLTLEVRDLAMDGDWWMKIWFANSSGTIGFDFQSLTVQTVLGIKSLNVSLIEFNVPSIGNIQCTRFTGASFASGIVKSIAQKVVNTQWVKNDISTTIETQAKELFNEIFTNFDWLKRMLCKGPRPTGGIRLN